MVTGATLLHLPLSKRQVAIPLPWLPPKPTAIFTIEGITAMHLASLMILSGMPLSGVAMISSSTLDGIVDPFLNVRSIFIVVHTETGCDKDEEAAQCE